MKAIAVFIIGFCGFSALMYLLQDSFIFFPVKLGQETLQMIRKAYPFAEEVTITAADNKSLRGWLVKSSGAGKDPLVIYFGGNAEEVSWLIGEADKLKAWSFALINYRGYGLSEGKPGEKELFSDSLAIFDYFSRREDIDNTAIVVMGRSIGTGVAVYLAQNRQVAGAILVSPFDSLVSIGKKHYPFLPVSLLLKHRFDSVSRAPSIKTPLLALIAENDTIIPRKSSMRLVEHWGGVSTVQVVAGDHNNIQNGEGYWESIQQFLSRF